MTWNEEVSGRAAAVFSAVALGAAWEAACRNGWVSPVLLSPPSRILVRGIDLLRSGAVAADIASTLAAFGLCLILALVLGVGLGVAMGMSKSLYHLFHPYVVSLNSVPKIALMPVLVLWFGLGLPPKLFLGTLMGCFPIAMAAYGGMRGLERDSWLVARAFGAGRLFILRTVITPGLVPCILSSLRVAVNYVLVGILTVEFFAADRGVGYKMVLYSSNFQTDSFFAMLFFVVALALGCTAALHQLERRMIRWRPVAWE